MEDRDREPSAHTQRNGFRRGIRYAALGFAIVLGLGWSVAILFMICSELGPKQPQ
jgi:hypothetical protein